MNAQLLQLNTSVSAANGELNAIRKLWEEQLKKSSELLPKQLREHLPQTADALKAARILNLSPPSQLASIQEGLRATDHTVPGYWPAMAQFISYQSRLESTVSPASRLTRCYDVPPALIASPGETKNIWKEPLEWRDCEVDLDEDMPKEWWDSITGLKLYREEVPAVKDLAGPNVLQFTDCLVHYDGGKIPDRIYKLLGFATFHNCLLELDYTGPPQSHGQELSEALLSSSSLKDVDLRPLRR